MIDLIDREAASRNLSVYALNEALREGDQDNPPDLCRIHYHLRAGIRLPTLKMADRICTALDAHVGDIYPEYWDEH